MKKFIVVISLLVSAQVFACQEEAQFMATIDSAQVVGQNCILKVKNFSRYDISGVCPLWDADVLSSGITTSYGEQTCASMKDTEISGYLVRPEGSSEIYLD